MLFYYYNKCFLYQNLQPSQSILYLHFIEFPALILSIKHEILNKQILKPVRFIPSGLFIFFNKLIVRVNIFEKIKNY